MQKVAPPAPVARRDALALDGFSFAVANLQTGFGPFLAVYLTAHKWTQSDIGLVLSVTGFTSLLVQIPAGAVVDGFARRKALALLAVAGIGASALLIALAPTFLAILVAKLVHVVSSSLLGPAFLLLTLATVGHVGLAERLGRNARFAGLGNGAAALAMGAIGTSFSAQSVFLVTAGLALPTLAALWLLTERPVALRERHDVERGSLLGLLLDPAVRTVMLALVLFHFGNAAMLPLVGSDVATRSSRWATALIALCIVGPQIVAAAVAPRFGRGADRIGRKPLLALGLCVVPLRAVLLSVAPNPVVVVLVQLLDGVSAAALGVLVPLVLADIAVRTGHVALLQGLAGCAAGLGGTMSVLVAGVVADRLGFSWAFLILGASACASVTVVALLFEETRPARIHPPAS